MVINIGKTEAKTMSWKRYERETARRHRGHHVGGSGNPDYLRGDAVGEVKHMQRPVTKPEVIKLRKKGVTEIHSINGFTESAIDHVQRYDMQVKLFHRGRRVA
jgi:hypothetical protein